MSAVVDRERLTDCLDPDDAPTGWERQERRVEKEHGPVFRPAEWFIEPGDTLSPRARSRYDRAVSALERAGLLRVAKRGASRHLHSTPKGLGWIYDPNGGCAGAHVANCPRCGCDLSEPAREAAGVG